MTEKDKPDSRFISPNELLKGAKDIMLKGREPKTEGDWFLVINFWAYNTHPDTHPAAVQLLCKIYNVPVEEEEVERICAFQALDKVSRMDN